MSLLQLFNNIKTSGEVPKFMKQAVISTIPKRGSKLLLTNLRGIFVVNSVRSIFMRLLYNLKKHKIEQHMSDSNAGGRENKSGINHIWVVNGIIHDHLSSVKKSPSLFNNMTIAKCLMVWIMLKPVETFLIMV